MASTISIPVPVWPQSKTTSGFARLPVLDVDVPAVQESEAPVALQFDSQKQHVPGATYRLHEGRLYMPALPDGPLRPQDLEAMVGFIGQQTRGRIVGPERLGYAGVFQPHFDAIYAHPEVVARGEQLDEDEHSLALASIRPSLDRLLFIGGALWKRSNGPVYGAWQMAHEERHPALSLLAGRTEARLVDKKHFVFSALDVPAMESAMRAVYGDFYFGGPFRQHLDVPPQDAVLFDAIENAVWHFLWEARLKPPSSGDRALVETVLAARDVLQARWPGTELEFIAKLHVNSGKHLFDRDAPPPGDLLDILERINEIAPDRFWDPVVRSWRLAQVRTEQWLERQHAAELDGLEIP